MSTTAKKAAIPRALREAVWIRYNGSRSFTCKCYVSWCPNHVTAFNFHVGHDVPESKGGATTIENLRPICDRCNLSMGNRYSIQEWSKEFEGEEKHSCCCSIM